MGLSVDDRTKCVWGMITHDKLRPHHRTCQHVAVQEPIPGMTRST